MYKCLPSKQNVSNICASLSYQFITYDIWKEMSKMCTSYTIFFITKTYRTGKRCCSYLSSAESSAIGWFYWRKWLFAEALPFGNSSFRCKYALTEMEMKWIGRNEPLLYTRMNTLIVGKNLEKDCRNRMQIYETFAFLNWLHFELFTHFVRIFQRISNVIHERPTLRFIIY